MIIGMRKYPIVFIFSTVRSVVDKKKKSSSASGWQSWWHLEGERWGHPQWCDQQEEQDLDPRRWEPGDDAQQVIFISHLLPTAPAPDGDEGDDGDDGDAQVEQTCDGAAAKTSRDPTEADNGQRARRAGNFLNLYLLSSTIMKKDNYTTDTPTLGRLSIYRFTHFLDPQGQKRMTQFWYITQNECAACPSSQDLL